jgi:hypothetical protein
MKIVHGEGWREKVREPLPLRSAVISAPILSGSTSIQKLLKRLDPALSGVMKKDDF